MALNQFPLAYGHGTRSSGRFRRGVGCGIRLRSQLLTATPPVWPDEPFPGLRHARVRDIYQGSSPRLETNRVARTSSPLPICDRFLSPRSTSRRWQMRLPDLALLHCPAAFSRRAFVPVHSQIPARVIAAASAAVRDTLLPLWQHRSLQRRILHHPPPKAGKTESTSCRSAANSPCLWAPRAELRQCRGLKRSHQPLASPASRGRILWRSYAWAASVTQDFGKDESGPIRRHFV